MLETIYKLHLLQKIVHPLFKNMIRCIGQFTRKNEGVRMHIKQLVQRNFKMIGELLHFCKINRFFPAYSTVCTVVTDIEQFSHFVYQGKMGRYQGFNMIKK